MSVITPLKQSFSWLNDFFDVEYVLIRSKGVFPFWSVLSKSAPNSSNSSKIIKSSGEL